eukprot:1728116-Pyramimonas_sp.AAC.1
MTALERFPTNKLNRSSRHLQFPRPNQIAMMKYLLSRTGHILPISWPTTTLVMTALLTLGIETSLEF